MKLIKTSLAVTLMALMAACSPAPLQPGQAAMPRLVATTSGAVVNVRLSSGFSIKAAEKTSQDIDQFFLQLVDMDGQTIVEDSTKAYTCQFVDVPDGTYSLVANALDANGDSIVEGGAQTSVNTVTVSAGSTTYSDDSGSLSVTLQLQHGTAGTGVIRNSITVIDGQPATEQPRLETPAIS